MSSEEVRVDPNKLIEAIRVRVSERLERMDSTRAVEKVGHGTSEKRKEAMRRAWPMIKEIVELEVWEGKSLRQVAEELGIVYGTVIRWRRKYPSLFMLAYRGMLEDVNEVAEVTRMKLMHKACTCSDELWEELRKLARGGEDVSKTVQLNAIKFGLEMAGEGGKGVSLEGGVSLSAEVTERVAALFEGDEEFGEFGVKALGDGEEGSS